MASLELLDLPYEVICEVLIWLGSHVELSRAGTVCVLFSRAANEPSVWKALLRSTFEVPFEWDWGGRGKLSSGYSFDWKRHFRAKLKFERTLFEWAYTMLETRGNEADDEEWLAKSGMAATLRPRMRHAATELPWKKAILLCGGHTRGAGGEFNRKDETHIFDCELNLFRQLAAHGLPKISRHSLVTYGRRVYSLCGILQDKRKTNDVLLFDEETLTWNKIEVTGVVPTPRNDSAAAVWRNYIVLFGGSLEGLIFPTDFYLFNLETYEWTQPVINGPLPPTRISFASVVVGDCLYIYGGGYWSSVKDAYTERFADMWILDLVNLKWTLAPKRGDCPTSMTIFCNMVAVGDFIIVDGGREFISDTESAFIFDTITMSWSKMKYVDDRFPNANSNTGNLVGTKAYYMGYYPSFFLDLAPLAFILNESEDGAGSSDPVIE